MAWKRGLMDHNLAPYHKEHNLFHYKQEHDKDQLHPYSLKRSVHSQGTDWDMKEKRVPILRIED